MQQLSHKSVHVIQSRLEAYCKTENGLGNTVAEEFGKQMKLLAKLTSEAKENVKFLTTLERQFKNLSSEEGFHVILETIPSLMNGLKMVWIISRNYKNSEKMQELISLITDEIADKVQANIQIAQLFNLSEKAETELSAARELIIQGKTILETWDMEFQRTQASMDDEQLERWEFQPAPLIDRCKYMIGILGDLLEITENMKKFLVFLGPNLKSVTGNSEGIDKLTLEVKDLVTPFRSAKENFFRKENHQLWGRLYNAFKDRQKQQEISTMKLIDETFKDLRSSEGAFDLLNNFKNIDTLP
jgi:dynein heavy chain